MTHYPLGSPLPAELRTGDTVERAARLARSSVFTLSPCCDRQAILQVRELERDENDMLVKHALGLPPMVYGIHRPCWACKHPYYLFLTEGQDPHGPEFLVWARGYRKLEGPS